MSYIARVLPLGHTRKNQYYSRIWSVFMQFEAKLLKGQFVKRYKRFFTDIKLENGEIITAHTPNTGSMKTCLGENWPCLVTPNDDPKRKLKYTLELIHNGDTWIGVHTGRPNKIVYEAIKNGDISEITEFNELKSEVKYGKSRIDLVASYPNYDHYIEVKNVTLKHDDKTCSFPDAVSTRGQKHLDELTEIAQSENKASMFFLVQREDVQHFTPAIEIDPIYADKLKKAYEKGVNILVYQCKLNEKEIIINKKLEIIWP